MHLDTDAFSQGCGNSVLQDDSTIGIFGVGETEVSSQFGSRRDLRAVWRVLRLCGLSGKGSGMGLQCLPQHPQSGCVRVPVCMHARVCTCAHVCAQEGE